MQPNKAQTHQRDNLHVHVPVYDTIETTLFGMREVSHTDKEGCESVDNILLPNQSWGLWGWGFIPVYLSVGVFCTSKKPNQRSVPT